MIWQEVLRYNYLLINHTEIRAMITINTTSTNATTIPAIPPPLIDAALVGTAVGDVDTGGVSVVLILAVEFKYKTVVTSQHTTS